MTDPIIPAAPITDAQRIEAERVAHESAAHASRATSAPYNPLTDNPPPPAAPAPTPRPSEPPHVHQPSTPAVPTPRRFDVAAHRTGPMSLREFLAQLKAAVSTGNIQNVSVVIRAFQASSNDLAADVQREKTEREAQRYQR